MTGISEGEQNPESSLGFLLAEWDTCPEGSTVRRVGTTDAELGPAPNPASSRSSAARPSSVSVSSVHQEIGGLPSLSGVPDTPKVPQILAESMPGRFSGPTRWCYSFRSIGLPRSSKSLNSNFPSAVVVSNRLITPFGW